MLGSSVVVGNLALKQFPPDAGGYSFNGIYAVAIMLSMR